VKQFSVIMRSFSDIQDFVSLSSRQPFEVTVGGDGHGISGKSLMAMLGLNLRQPLVVNVECGEQEFLQFCSDAARFLV
jgi:hypothetical protein